MSHMCQGLVTIRGKTVTFRSYVLSKHMRSMLPRDGSNAFKVHRLERSIGLHDAAYYCRPSASYLAGGQQAHDLVHTGADADDVCRCSCRAVSRGV
jgi:hypothetical protein